ncbi:MAG: CocE/NonD family hydrolase [Methanoregulaceae archaeon]|nr:CocE/NonD family hydrolase [Methanoregulaceae archaeon]
MSLLVPLLLLSCAPAVQEPTYRKLEFQVPMRDGVKLHTVVYVPTHTSGKSPILLERTPYSAGPYGEQAMSPQNFGGSRKFIDAGYIFVQQDVRGRFMSEGKFEEIRPLRSLQGVAKATDESTDAYDTAEFLLKNVPNNNGNIGVWGISYPGFYAACAAANSHPAIKAISPQAPVSEWFFGDDVHHNGAFFLQDNFDFYFFFGLDMDKPAPRHPQLEGYGPRADAYKFFLEKGSPDDLERTYFKGRIPFWRDIIEHPNYDDFWKARSTPRHLKNVRAAVLTVGGWFDAENLYGAFDTYQHLRKLNPGLTQHFVVGPWPHGGWARGTGQRYAGLDFSSATSTWFREEVEFPFFERHLRGVAGAEIPKVQMFNTGRNVWKSFAEWPPTDAKPSSLVLRDAKPLGPQTDRYVSDPASPVPYQSGTIRGRNSAYTVADQSFVKDRPDVLTFAFPPLTEELTMAGAVEADLTFTTDATDLDFIVKVIDQYPADHPTLGGQLRLVRAEVMPARFRASFETPTPLEPGKPQKVTVRLPDVFHTWRTGHRVVVQIQSSWFPLVARNPQVFGNPYKIPVSQYRKANVTVDLSSAIRFGKMP